MRRVGVGVLELYFVNGGGAGRFSCFSKEGQSSVYCHGESIKGSKRIECFLNQLLVFFESFDRKRRLEGTYVMSRRKVVAEHILYGYMSREVLKCGA